MARSATSLFIAGSALFLTACQSEKAFEDKLTKALDKNPELIVHAIEQRPSLFVEAFQKAVKTSREELAVKRKQEEQQKLERAFKNPLRPLIRSDEAMRGRSDAPLVLVKYGDFECAFCARGAEVVQKLQKRYGDKLVYIYKHLPLSFHAKAMVTAKYFEALRLQDPSMAFQFHDQIYKDPTKVKMGKKYFNRLAQKLGADVKRLKNDLASEVVANRIAQDLAEAKKFDLLGTPAFVINGIPVKGAYPASHFNDIISELQRRKLVKL
jgi:protein-disulfide isomerase